MTINKSLQSQYTLHTYCLPQKETNIAKKTVAALSNKYEICK